MLLIQMNPRVRTIKLGLVCVLHTICAIRVCAQDKFSPLEDAAHTESQIKTGVVKYRITTQYPLKGKHILPKNSDPKIAAIEEKIDDSMLAQESETRVLEFDNSKNSFVYNSTRDSDHSTNRVSVSNTIVKSFSRRDSDTNVHGHGLVRVSQGTWPPVGPEVFLISRKASSVLQHILAQSPRPIISEADKVPTLLINWGESATFNQEIRLSRGAGNLIDHINYYRRKNNNKLDSNMIITYKRYDGLLYPDSYRETRYIYDSAGNRLTSMDTKIDVIEVQLNVPVGHLEFGDIPEGTEVSDRRFSKSLTYMQGKKQFTDEELFAATKNKKVVEIPIARKTRAAYPPIYQIAVMILVPLLVVLLLFRFRRKRAP